MVSIPINRLKRDVAKEKKQFAKLLRKRKTKAEDLFFRKVQSWKSRGMLPKFSLRSQRVIGPFIPDFVIEKFGIFIEIDGPYHSRPEQMVYDSKRDAIINRKTGFLIIRFTNSDVSEREDYVLKTLSTAIHLYVRRGYHKIALNSFD